MTEKTSSPENEAAPVHEIAALKHTVEKLKLEIRKYRRTLGDLLMREENCQTLFDASNEAFIILDPETASIVDFSGKVAEMFGYSPEEIMKKGAGCLFSGPSPCLSEKALRLIQEAPSEGLKVFEWNSYKKDGRPFWIEVCLKRASISGRESIITLIRDITVRKISETSLRESENRYRTVFENTGAATFVNDEDMTLSMVNSEFENLTGYSKEEIEGRMKWTDFIHPDDHERLKGYHVERRRTGLAPRETTCKLIDRQGNVRELFLKVDLIPGTKKSIGSFIDITKIKETETALAESKARFSAILEGFDGLIYVCTKDYQIEYINERMVKRKGSNPCSEPCYKALHDRQSPCPFCVMEQVQTGQSVRFEVKDPRDGRWYHSANTPIVHADGTISLLALITDIHDRKMAESALLERERYLRRENIILRSSTRERYKFGNIVGKSSRMQEVYELILNAAATDANVIIYGESGTGKELVARAIHDMSDRRDKAFIPVNCGAIPENLLETEFFGYKKGAFTGAAKDKPGYLDGADGGTLFLDELGELDPKLQVKLLRAIESGGYTPVGDTREKKSNFRIIAATHRDLKEQVKCGRMREDFFYRINIIPIFLPPLRERKEDLPLLIAHFVGVHGAQKDIPPISGKILESMQNYDWPGNVRELQNVILRYISLRKIDISSFSQSVTADDAAHYEKQLDGKPQDLRTLIKTIEKSVIKRSLEQNQWNRSKVAALLGVDRKTLRKKIKAYGLRQA